MSTFFPRLDGLRAFAVVAVMVHHWHQPTILGRELPLGFIGVQLFFVLSGFLIGGILLRSQERNELEGTSQAFTLRQFIIRRAIRIFPAYFLFLLATGVLLGAPDKEWWWYPLYLGNFRTLETGVWPGYWAHTWSLAVEEQFYLFAPLLVLFLRRKSFCMALPALIVASAFFILATPASAGTALVPPKAFYGLLLGVGLALLTERATISTLVRRTCAIAAIASGSAAFVLELHDGRLFSVIAPIAFGSLVLWATGSGPAGRFLEWKPLMHLGGLAYGLYLWHMPVETMWGRLGLPTLANSWVVFVMFSVFTYTLAWLSWTLLEKPLNRHKNAFPYHRSAVNLPAQAQPAIR